MHRSYVNLNRDRESRAFEGLFNLFKKIPFATQRDVKELAC